MTPETGWIYEHGTGHHSVEGLRRCAESYAEQAVDESNHPSNRRAARRYIRNIEAMIAAAVAEGRWVAELPARRSNGDAATLTGALAGHSASQAR
jgi:hypothetical protein